MKNPKLCVKIQGNALDVKIFKIGDEQRVEKSVVVVVDSLLIFIPEGKGGIARKKKTTT